MTILDKNISKISLMIVICIFFIKNDAYSQYTEYEIRGVMVFQFIKNTTFDAKVFEKEKKIKLGILGEDPFGIVIDNIVRNRSIGGRGIEIIRKTDIKDLVGCHIVYVCKSEEFIADEILDYILNKNRFSSVLTIGDNIENFCKLGGIINFKEGERKYGFNINIKTASDKKLLIDTKLMRLANEIIAP